MNFTCNECNDTGSRDKLGTYLDCNACGTAAIRRELNDFVKSLGPTHPEDVALAIHQRALAMAPKQEAPGITSLPKWHHFVGEPSHRDDDCGEWCLVSDAISHGIIHAAPAAANGAPDDQPLIGKLMDKLCFLPVLWGLNEPGALLRHSDVFRMLVDAGNTQEYVASRAILAAAGPDAALIKALKNALASSIIGQGSYGLNYDGNKIAGFVLAALSGAKGN